MKKTIRKAAMALSALLCFATTGAYADGIEVTPTANANEWTFTMPGGDVELEVAYKDSTAVLPTFDGEAIPAEGVAAYLGFEAEFADSLSAVVTNVESGAASAVVENPTLTFKSSNVNAIAFKDGEAFVDEGALGNMVFRAVSAEPVTLTVQFTGSDDLGKSSATMLVAVAEKISTADLAAGTEDASNWKVKAGEGDYQAFPVSNVGYGASVYVQYGGEKVVKSVKAVKAADPKLAVPLTIEALTAGTINVANPKAGMQYSLNGGDKTAVTADPINVAAGDKVAFYGNGTSIAQYGDSSVYSCTRISGDAQVKVYGNIMSLVDETGFATNKTLTANYTFANLFYLNTKLTDASGLLLPAETLTESCYAFMFRDCSVLTVAPELPATTLADSCYRRMFHGCESLAAAPELKATTLANGCYQEMFKNCGSLNSVTCLATDINASDCTRDWLAGVAASGTFTKASGVDWSGKGIPTWNGWTVEEAAAAEPEVAEPEVTEWDLTPTENANEWTFAMPEFDVELQVAYYTEDELAALAVDALIADIGEVAYTAESKALIDAAREAYDALTGDQKAFVAKYDALSAAETAYLAAEDAAFTAGVELTNNGDGTWTLDATPHFDVELEVTYYTDDELAALDVDALIDAIGEVAFTPESEALIDAARKAYDALTGDQKALVSNYDVLEAAEAAYNAYFHTVSLAGGTEDIENWTAKAGEGDFAALPLKDVTSNTVVTVQYGGTKVVKSVKAVDPKLAVPLTIEALTAGTIKVNIGYGGGTLTTGMKYSKNGGEKTTIYNTTDIVVAEGDTVQFYGNGTSTQVYGGVSPVGILGDGAGFTCKVYGNIMSLVDETGFATNKTLTANKTFTHLFRQNNTLTDASDLLLPAETLAENCYASMFMNCVALTTAPALPAKTLAKNCYDCMFYNCQSLTVAPELKATTLVSSCYRYMFRNCGKLNSVTCLATDIDADSCTQSWLQDVAGSGTFTKAAGVDWSGKTGYNGIPSGWTVEEEAAAEPEPAPADIELTPTENANEWTFTMLDRDVKLQVAYYTEDELAVMAVEALIDAIGEVEPTAECKKKIDDAIAAFDALTPYQKTLVANCDVLEAAESSAAYKRATFEEQLSADLATVADKAEAIEEAFEGIEAITNLIAEIDGRTVVEVAGTVFEQIMADADQVDVNNAEITNALVQVLGMTDDEITALPHVLVVDPLAFLTGKKVTLAYGTHGYELGEASNPDTFEVAYTSSKTNEYTIVADASADEAARVFSFRTTADGIPVAIKLPETINLVLAKNGEETLNADLELYGDQNKTYQVLRDDEYLLNIHLYGTVKEKFVNFNVFLGHTADREYLFDVNLNVDGEGIVNIHADGQNTPYDEETLKAYVDVLEGAGGVWGALGKLLGFVNGRDLDNLSVVIRDNLVIEGKIDDIGGMLAGLAQIVSEGEVTNEKIDALTAMLTNNVSYTVTQLNTGIEAEGSFVAGDLFGAYLPLVPETHGEGAVENSKSVTYDAYVLDADGNAYGTVKVTVGRVGKNGLSSVKAVVKPYNDKSMTFKATEAKGGKATVYSDEASTVELAYKTDVMTLIIGAEGLEGVCTIAGVDYEINGSRNRVKTDKASYDFWMGARAAVFADETGAIVATFSFEMKPNGKVSVRGQFANGKTTNGTVHLMIADSGEEASVVINGSKKLPFSAVVWLGKNGAVTVESITTSVANGVACAAAGGAGGLSEGSYKFQTGNLEIPLTLKGKKFTSADAKATYKPKTGEFSGSYDERYTNAKGKTKKSKVKFGGVFVDGIGYGTTKSGATVTIVPAAE